MAKDQKVTVAGKVYPIRYEVPDADEIEGFASAPGRNLQDMLFHGTMKERAAIVWGGLKHADKKLTPHQVMVLFGSHVALGGEWDRDIFLPCARAAFESRLLGAYNEREVDRIMSDLGEDQPGDTGKD